MQVLLPQEHRDKEEVLKMRGMVVGVEQEQQENVVDYNEIFIS